MLNKIGWILLSVILLSALALIATGVTLAELNGGKTHGNQQQLGSQEAVGLGVTHILIQNDVFHPAHIQVAIGTAVTWTNEDSSSHSVIFSPPVVISTHDIWASGPLSQGESFSYTFMMRGTFTYHCGEDPMMGVVTVV